MNERDKKSSETRKKLTINKTTLRRLTDPTIGAGAPGVAAHEPETAWTTSVAGFGIYCAENRN